MVSIDSCRMIVYGGRSDSGLLSGGVIVDCNNRNEIRKLDAGDSKFSCCYNTYITTEKGDIIAIAKFKENHKMIEVSSTDFAVTELQDLA